MIKVKKPDFDLKEIVNACIYNIRAGNRLNNLLASKSTIIRESENYDELAIKEGLSLIGIHETITGGATKEDMVWLYDAKFVKDGGRDYYDKILLLPQNGICPLCGKRKVATLDHYLPKTKYPVYAVTPFNLVAACSDCNKAKSVDIINSRDDETIHPYYDDFDDEVWIKANIIEEFPLGFTFMVNKPESWDDIKFQRAKKHFDTFNLNSLYKSHAADIFAPYKVQLKRLYMRRGDIAIKEDLVDRVESYKEIRLNSLEVAMYTALLGSRWFFETYIPSEMES